MHLNAVVWDSWQARLVLASMVLVATLGCEVSTPRSDDTGGYSLQLIARGEGDSIGMGRPLIFRGGPNGMVYVAVQLASGLPMVIDSVARFAGTIGHIGPGPGESEFVSQLYPKADSIIVGDLRGDLSLFTPDRKYLKTLNPKVTTIGQTLLLRGDTLLLAEPIFDTERFGLPLHLIAPDGDTVRSFGSADRNFDRRMIYQLIRHVDRASDSTIWVAHHDRYQIELWHMNGTLLRTMSGQRDWFPRLQSDWGVSTDRPYPTVLRDVHQDRYAHLIVMMERARGGVVPPGETSHHESGKTTSLVDRLTVLEQIIEILDANTGDLIATIPGPSDVFLMRSLSDDRIVGIGTDAQGLDVPVLFRIVRPPISQ